MKHTDAHRVSSSFEAHQGGAVNPGSACDCVDTETSFSSGPRNSDSKGFKVSIRCGRGYGLGHPISLIWNAPPRSRKFATILATSAHT